jgi:mRNA interferase MazF
MDYKRGDVLLAIFPFSDLIHFKKRPVIVVQDENVTTEFDQQVCAQITSKDLAAGPTRIPVDKDTDAWHQMGLLSDSLIVTDKLGTVDAVAIDKAIGSCPCMDKVDEALSVTLKLSVRTLE